MGSADVVPGVSGGTIAFIAGIYEELISSINNINLNAFKVLRKRRASPLLETRKWCLFRGFIKRNCNCHHHTSQTDYPFA